MPLFLFWKVIFRKNVNISVISEMLSRILKFSLISNIANIDDQ